MSTPRASAQRGRALGLGRLLRRSVLTAPAATVAVTLVVTLAAFLAAAAPEVLSQASTAALRYDVASDATADQADVIAQASGGPVSAPSAGGAASTGLPPEVDAVWGAQDDALQELRAGLADPLSAALGEPVVTVTSDRVPLSALPGAPPARSAQLGFAFDPRYRDRVELVSGAWPGDTPDPLTTGSPVEIVLAEPVSDDLDWPVGETRQVVFGDGSTQAVTPTGIVAAIDPSDPYWLHTPTLLRPGIVPDGSGGTVVVAQAYLNPAVWPAAAGLPVHEQTQAWFPALPDALTASSAPVVNRQLREFMSSPHALGSATGAAAVTDPSLASASFEPAVTALTFSSRLPTLIDHSLARDAATTEVIAMAVSGPIGVLAGVVLLGASLLLRRRSSTLALLAARGASPGQLRGLLALEGAMAGVVGVVLGTATGLVVASVVAAPSDLAPTRILRLIGVAVFLAAIPVVVLVLQGRHVLGRSRGAGAVGVTEPDATGAAARRIRWIADGVILLATVASIVLLAVGGTTDSTAAFDPVPAAAPLLIALTVCALTVRVYPAVLGASARWARSTVGVVAFLGSVRARRRPPGGTVLVFAVVIGVGIALFSTVFLSTVRSGIDTAAQADLGADISIRGQGIPESVIADIDGVPGVEATAAVYADQPVVVTVGGSRTRVRVVVVDTQSLAAVQHGRPGAIELPPGLTGPVKDGKGSTLPVLASAPAVADLGGGEPSLNGHPLDVLATSATSALPFTTASSWLLVDREHGDAAVGDISSIERVLVRVAPGADPATVAAAAQGVVDDAISTGSAVTTAQGVALTTAENPRITALQTTLAFAIGFSLLLCAGAVVMTIALGRDARARLIGLTSALGADSRQNRALALWEMAPTVLIATLGGVVAGAVASLVVLTLADLTAFTGGADDPAVTVDPLTAVGAVVAFLVVAGGAVALSTVSIGRARRTPARLQGPTEEG